MAFVSVFKMGFQRAMIGGAPSDWDHRIHTPSRSSASGLWNSTQRFTRCYRRRGCNVVALFTGIVQGKATVRNVDRKPELCSFDIEFPSSSVSDVRLGASVAINGTCLTVVEQYDNVLRFDVIAESLRRTNLGLLDVGSAVNFERSAKVGDEIGGHTVSGHVHSTAKISKLDTTEDNVRMEFELTEKEWIKYILPKGFVAVDGCSLTVGEVEGSSFSVYLIPETLRVTVLGSKKEGDYVNVEIEAQTQAIVDTVEKVVARYLKEGNLKASSGSP